MTKRGDREVALDLMRMALALLDHAGELVPAARLQAAIDEIAPETEGSNGLSVGDDGCVWSIAGPRLNPSRRS